MPATTTPSTNVPCPTCGRPAHAEKLNGTKYYATSCLHACWVGPTRETIEASNEEWNRVMGPISRRRVREAAEKKPTEKAGS